MSFAQLAQQIRLDVAELEEKLRRVEREAEEKDQALLGLIANRPVAWFCQAPSLASKRQPSFTVDNKYFTAEVLVVSGNELLPVYASALHAVVLGMETFDCALAERVLLLGAGSDAEVKLCVCADKASSALAVEWCADNGVELVDSSSSPESRVEEALGNTIWPSAVMKQNPVPPQPHSKQQPNGSRDLAPKREQAEASLEEFESLLAQAKQVKARAGSEASDEQRRQRATEAAMKMLQFLGDESDSEED
ncbi:hypothetical protein BASA81_000019 [Batrachochytrium salamandrivorans]|nr:hypothetical protein BASA81_000019 [Batrachochytrium salamandrivorans]